jgi:hypothetical protein
MPQTLLVLPKAFADRIPGMLITAGVFLAGDRQTSRYRKLTCEQSGGRVTVTFMNAPRWARRLDETVTEETVVVGVARGGWRFFRRADDHDLHDRIVQLFEPHALMEPSRLGKP